LKLQQLKKREEARNAPPPEAPGQANYQKALAAAWKAGATP
jgi:hypothetical protein